MGDALFSVHGVVFNYDRYTAIDDITFTVNPGEFMGIIGPNGAGKSTVIRLLAGFLKPNKGFVAFSGKNLDKYEKRELAQNIATLPQATETPFSFTVEEFILMGRYPYAQKNWLYEKKEEEFVEYIIDTMEISHLRGRTIDTLSEGERQKVFLSQCLAQDPKALLLDEPVSHLDIRHQMQTFDVLEKLHNEGLTIIMVLHDLNLAAEFCSRLMLISKGRINADGDPKTVLTFQNIEEAYDTVVIVKENPLSGKPFVVPVSRKYLGK
ncbi:MAG TPA: ABC transporter ATP-binding protein [Syntrophorhabdus sp.]|nr:ABC transporter ATP-binding protein [Syntrophorhabdus sp.]